MFFILSFIFNIFNHKYYTIFFTKRKYFSLFKHKMTPEEILLNPFMWAV